MREFRIFIKTNHGASGLLVYALTLYDAELKMKERGFTPVFSYETKHKDLAAQFAPFTI